MTVCLETPRLIVREFAADDAEALARAFADPAVLWWEQGPFTIEKARAWVAAAVASYARSGVGLYAVILRAEGRLIGDSGLVPRTIEGEEWVEIGWHLERAAWDHGYATEAARGVVTHAAGLGLPRLCALISPDNARSRRVAEKLGMAVERRVEWAGLPHELWVLDALVLP